MKQKTELLYNALLLSGVNKQTILSFSESRRYCYRMISDLLEDDFIKVTDLNVKSYESQYQESFISITRKGIAHLLAQQDALDEHTWLADLKDDLKKPYTLKGGSRHTKEKLKILQESTAIMMMVRAGGRETVVSFDRNLAASRKVEASADTESGSRQIISDTSSKKDTVPTLSQLVEKHLPPQTENTVQFTGSLVVKAKCISGDKQKGYDIQQGRYAGIISSPRKNYLTYTLSQKGMSWGSKIINPELKALGQWNSMTNASSESLGIIFYHGTDITKLIRRKSDLYNRAGDGFHSLYAVPVSQGGAEQLKEILNTSSGYEESLYDIFVKTGLFKREMPTGFYASDIQLRSTEDHKFYVFLHHMELNRLQRVHDYYLYLKAAKLDPAEHLVLICRPHQTETLNQIYPDVEVQYLNI